MSEQPAQVICPYCGHTQTDAARCEVCRGLFEPLSRQATQNAMGPWFIRDESQPFRPGCCYEVLVRMIERGKVTRDTIIRGPTTRQFWKRADHVQGLSHLMNVCFSCGERVGRTDVCCEYCGAMFTENDDRQTLGLAPVRSIEAMAAGGVAEPQDVADDHMNSVGYDRLRAAVEAAASRKADDSARSALAQAAEEEGDGGDASGVPRQPRRRRTIKEQLTPGQLVVERRRRERRMFLVKASIGGVTIFLAALMLIWLLVWAGAISLPFALPGTGPAAAGVVAPAGSGDKAAAQTPDEAAALVPGESMEGEPVGGPPPPEQALDPAHEALLDLYAQAVRLVDGVTIAELEQAEKILIQVRDDLPANLHPEDLPAQLRKAQQRLTRLRLDEPPEG